MKWDKRVCEGEKHEFQGSWNQKKLKNSTVHYIACYNNYFAYKWHKEVGTTMIRGRKKE